MGLLIKRPTSIGFLGLRTHFIFYSSILWILFGR